MNETEAAYRRLFASPDGVTVLNDLLKSVNMAGSVFFPETAVGMDPVNAAFRDGQRRVVADLIYKSGLELTPTRRTDGNRDRGNDPSPAADDAAELGLTD